MNGIIRKVKKSDIDAVYRIEKKQVFSSWKRNYFEDELSNDLSSFYIIEDFISNEIIGYIIFWIIDDIAELHSIAIDEKYKRKGYAAELMRYMFDTVKSENVNEIFLEVRVSNKAAVSLYEKLEFIKINSRKNYYKNPVEDAFVFKKTCCQ